MISDRIFFILRVLLGAVFLVSGFEKVTQPYQNFVYILQAYDILPTMMEKGVALFFPWLELMVGMFVVLGLWLKMGLRVVVGMLCVFIGVLSQALWRGLDLSDCGCFGALIHIPPQGTLIVDTSLLILTIVFLKHIERVTWFSLDRYL